MNAIIKISLLVLGLICTSVANAQDAKVEAKVEAKNVQCVQIVITFKRDEKVYAKSFGSNLAFDKGLGLRHETMETLVPAQGGIYPLTTMVQGQTQVRTKTWGGLVDTLAVIYENNKFVYINEDIVANVRIGSQVDCLR